MAISNLQLGSLHLQAPSDWEFFPFEHIIFGRASRRGSLQITLAYTSHAPKDAGHEACVDVMRQFMDVPASTSIYAEHVPQYDAVFGFATIHDIKAFRRYWYRHKNARLVLALFQCVAENFVDARTEIDEAGSIAATMEMVG